LRKAKILSPSFPDVQLHIVDAPLGAGPESILPIVVMDSGFALARLGMTKNSRCSSFAQHILLHLAAVEMEEGHRRIVVQGAAGQAFFELA
jgi:hypothetical protein